MEMEDSVVVEPESSVMGNELSQGEGVKQSVGGEGQAGQFHKVLVDTDQSQPNPELPDANFVISRPADETVEVQQTDNVEDAVTSFTGPEPVDVHSQSTLQIRGVADPVPAADDTSAVSDKPEDDALIEECKTLISEAADRAVHRSLSQPQKPDQVTDLDAASLNDVVEHPQIVDQRKSGSIQSINEITVSTNPSGDVDEAVDTPDQNSEDHSNDTDKVSLPTVVETIEVIGDKDNNVTETDLDKNVKEANEKNKKKKNKSKKDINKIEREVIETVNDQLEKELKEVNNKTEKKSAKGNLFSNMFKFSRKKTKTSSEDSADSKCVNGNSDLPTTSSVENKASASTNGIGDTVSEVKRLDSLDSGIVEEKIEQNVETVEYAVVQKKKETEEANTVQDVEIVANPVVGQRLAEPLYINGDKMDEDFVYINERAVDVDGLNKGDVPCIFAASPGVDGALGGESKKISEEERQSDVSSDSGTGSGSKASPVVSPGKTKLKKKTWSFQFGKKKTSSKTKEVETSPVSMDPTASPLEEKKSRWRFGKFSFRKSTPDMSVSTPNLHQAHIPEEDETVTSSGGKQKKKSKLKLPKLKKDKKKENPTDPEEASLEKRSLSLTDLDLADSSPRSRKSIVEEEANLSQTDAFEGVSLSDLSIEGDVVDSSKGEKKKKKKKSSKKETEAKAKAIVKEVIKKAEKKNSQDAKENLAMPVASGQVQQVTESLDGSLPKEQVYVNHETTVEESMNPDTIDDEYVNIASTIQVANMAPMENGIDHETVQDTEYAVIVKKKQKDLVDEINETLLEKAQKEQEREENDIPENATEENKTEIDKDSIIEPPTDFKDNVKEESPKAGTSQEQAFDNMTYSNESFQQTMESIKKLKPDENNDSRESTEFPSEKSSVKEPTDKNATAEDASRLEFTVTTPAVELSSCQTPTAQEPFIQHLASEKPIVDEPTVSKSANEQATTEESVHTVAVQEEMESPAEASEQTEKINDAVGQIQEQTEPAETDDRREENQNTTYNAEVIENDSQVDDDKFVVENESIDQVNLERPEKEIVIVELKPVQAEVTHNEPKPTEDCQINCTKVGALEAVSVNSVNNVGKTSVVDTSIENVTSFPDIEILNSERKIIIMKDAGVQAPDIYIPLDIEKDFGFPESKHSKVSIGVQVETLDVTTDHLVTVTEPVSSPATIEA